MLLRAGLLLALYVVCAGRCVSQTAGGLNPRYIDGTGVGAPINLGQTWLLHPGDDARWADPRFNDSQWTVVQANVPMEKYGFKNVEYVWYRTHVRVPATAHDLALVVREFSGSNRIFVNGVLVGGYGEMAFGGSNVGALTPRYYIPNAVLNGGDLTIAVRADIGGNAEGGRHGAGFVSESAVLLGPAAAVADDTALFYFREFTSNGFRTLLNFVLLLIAFSLALSMRSQKEYLALGVYLASNLADQAVFLYRTINDLPTRDWTIAVNVTLAAFSGVAILEFVRLVLGLRRTRPYMAYLLVMVLWSTVAEAFYEHFLQLSATIIPDWIIVGDRLVTAVLFLPIYVGIPYLSLWIGFRRRNRDAFLLALIFFTTSVFDYYATALFIAGRLHLVADATIHNVPLPGLHVRWNEVDGFISNLVLLVFLLLRTLRLARSQAKSAAEIQAAQSVQQLLLAKASQLTPGFEVESVYLPADEVGGDFFLVSPNAEDGSITAIVGDVSGHG